MLSKANRRSFARLISSCLRIPRRMHRGLGASHAMRNFRKQRAAHAKMAYQAAFGAGRSFEECKATAARIAAQVPQPELSDLRSSRPLAPSAPVRRPGHDSKIARREISSSESSPETQAAYEAVLKQREEHKAAAKRRAAELRWAKRKSSQP